MIARLITTYYGRDGARGLAGKPRGRTLGEQRALAPAQEVTIRTLICDKTPGQLKLRFALWNRLVVRELIRMRSGVGNYLARWGWTPQKPIKRRTSSALRRSRPGWTSSILRLPDEPIRRTRKSVGVTRRGCAATTSADAAMPRGDRPRKFECRSGAPACR